jgi:uncharacterized protein YjbJ (UPF0337 family)
MQAVAVDVVLGRCAPLSRMKPPDRVILKACLTGIRPDAPTSVTGCVYPNNERYLMSTVDKAKNKVQEAKGHLEEAAGKASNDRSRQAKGKRDKASGNLKQAGEKVKDAFGK